MFTVFASRFSLGVDNDESLYEAYHGVRQTIQQQVSDFLRTRDTDVVLSWDQPFEWQADDRSTSLAFDDWQDSETMAYRLTKTTLKYTHKDHRWEIDLKVGMATEVQSLAICATWSRSTLIRDAYPLSRMPQLLRSLIREDHLPAGVKLPFSVEPVCAEEVRAFCEAKLQHERRTSPIILVSPDRSGYSLVDSNVLAENLLGIAQVFLLKDQAAVEEFKCCVGVRRACYDGAVRVYWPDFGTNDRTTRRDYWTAIQQKGIDRATLYRDIFQRVAQASPKYFQLPDVLHDLGRVLS